MYGASRPRNEGARAFDSVPGSEDSGLTLTSIVALDGRSRASRTSIGPETEARASISPFDKHENQMRGGAQWELPNPNGADPSTLATLSYTILTGLKSFFTPPASTTHA